MNKHQYLTYRRSIRDNGIRYTLEHAPKLDSYTLAKLDILSNMEDLLSMRVRWINNPDTSKANIIRLTSPIL